MNRIIPGVLPSQFAFHVVTEPTSSLIAHNHWHDHMPELTDSGPASDGWQYSAVSGTVVLIR
jgi:hypothetical protein